MRYTVEIASLDMMYILSFMMTGIGVQAILKLYFRNLKGRNIGIIDVRDL
jgi:hypothetical protein